MSETSKTVIVTGANRGIGIQIVRHLVAEGYRVAACVRSRSDTLDEIVATGKGLHSIFTIDMSDPTSIKDNARILLDWSGIPVGLVNCAGLAKGSLFSMTRMEDLQAVYQVNLFGPLLLSQYVAKKMLRAKSGSIVNIASTAGLLADSGTLAYGGSKASLMHASRVMATELGAFGIRVNAIAPSVVETDMASLMDEQARAKLDSRSALSGKIYPDDVADLVSFLLSSASSAITGQVIRIDRGMPF
jgi:3-oxoacyl-[acyl-carrier protein] reductase